MPAKKPPGLTKRRAERENSYWLLLSLTLTLLLRLLFIWEMRHHPFSTISPQMVDPWEYHRWAREILGGNFWGSDVFFLRPIYPYLLALLYTLFGEKPLAVQLFQAFLATLSCFFLFETTRRLFNPRTARFAALGFAFCGVLVFYTGTLLYVAITIFLSLLALYLILFSAGRWWRWALAGIAFGLFLICRPEMLLIFPFILVWLGWKKIKPRDLTILTSTTILIIAIIPIRNFIVAKDPVPFTAHSGINFYYGNNPKAAGTWQPAGELKSGIGFSHQRLKRSARIINGKELSWSKASAYWTKQALSFIFSQPAQYLKLLLAKLLLFFSNYEVPSNYYLETTRPYSLALKIAFINFGIVVSLGIIGLFSLWRIRQEVFPFYLFTAGYFFSALIFYVLSRLRAPIIPFLLPFSGFALNEISLQIKKKLPGPVVIKLAIFLLLYLSTNLIPVNRSLYLSQAWTQLGNIYLEQNRVSSGITALNQALKFNPKNLSTRYSLIQAYAGIGRVNEAAVEFRQLTKTIDSSKTGLLFYHLAGARVAIAQRDFPKAVEHYQQALIIDPEDPETYYLLGLVYLSLNDLESAERCLLHTIALDPNHAPAQHALNEIRRHLNKMR